MAVDTAAAGASETKDPLTLHSLTRHDTNHVPPDLSVGEIHLPTSVSPAMIQLIKDKNREWEGVKIKGTPLTLLNLPVDLTYTNDVIALAMTHSALYKLALPNIYSRFDIVWPDVNSQTQGSKCVDALSYGLATLCLPSRFAETTQRSRAVGRGRPNISHRLANNDYAKYIRKFSIGDGPPEWTSEYLITKESGKMLGTLVAVAVSKMVNLETFVWDMPTGVLSDVFMALSSHEDDQGQAKLEKVWIRWHNSSTTSSSSSASSPTTVLPTLNPPPPILPSIPGALPQPKSYAQSCAEYPTFSVLPPLKSLTVLDIDDLSYLDEMSVLIERSASQLRELQVGMSKRACDLHDFARPWYGANLQQVDHEAKWPGESRIPTTRLGGVLGVLVGRIHDIRRTPKSKSCQISTHEQNADAPNDEKTMELVNETNEASQPRVAVDDDFPTSCPDRKCLEGKLKLETLALERVTLSIAVCSRAIDWSGMTSLTILNCQHHEALWKVLRHQFQPTPPALGSPKGTSTRYHLSLKRISTDVVSPALLGFLKETIAPNTMETIFLQDRQRTIKPSVTLEQVFKSAVKRQRHSLKRLLIDSSDKETTSISMGNNGRWRHWAVKNEFLSYITSGRMTSLRELGMVIDCNDWHTLLQQLPQMANLRSLYIPQMVGRDSRSSPTPRELALQVPDIISLRREIRLTYVGLWHKCFEITEVKRDDRSQDDNDHVVSTNNGGNSEGDDMTDEEEDEDEDDEVEAFMDAENETTEEISSDDQSEADSFMEETANNSLPRLGLREILYYDENVEIFRARHGKL
ncbi:hypothetical protein FHL15_001114 [Xylaria flabelliformis]|uniref:F-box domain-containing protein n=1 Tax=Xylaria flabelliformis TaxID=2512241 RepID=A0A553ICH6_9PEZI|nr:hypothetical protein FHL15_001114 [Xylaria flabelliformis]